MAPTPDVGHDARGQLSGGLAVADPYFGVLTPAVLEYAESPVALDARTR